MAEQGWTRQICAAPDSLRWTFRLGFDRHGAAGERAEVVPCRTGDSRRTEAHDLIGAPVRADLHGPRRGVRVRPELGAGGGGGPSTAKALIDPTCPVRPTLFAFGAPIVAAAMPLTKSIVLMMTGIPSRSFRSGAPVVHDPFRPVGLPLDTGCHIHLILSLCNLTRHRQSIQSFVDDHAMSSWRTIASLCASLLTILTEFDTDMSQLFDQQLDLIKLYYLIQHKVERIVPVSNCIDQIRSRLLDPRSGTPVNSFPIATLSILYDEVCRLVQLGRPGALSACLAIFRAAIEPFLTDLQYYCQNGRTIDGDIGFCCSTDPVDDRGERLAACPTFIDSNVLQVLCKTGTVIRLLADSKNRSTPVAECGIRSLFLDGIDKLLSDLRRDPSGTILPVVTVFVTRHLSDPIRDNYARVSTATRNQLVPHELLVRYFNDIRALFLMEEGQIITRTIQLCRENNRSMDVAEDEAEINLLFQSAMDEAHYESLSVCTPRLIITAKSISLDYQVPWPISLIIGSAQIMAYNSLFQLLVDIRRSLCTLHHIHAATQQGRLLLWQVRHFMQGLHQYVLDRVLNHKWTEFLKSMQLEIDVEGLISLHSSYLEGLLRDTLLDARAEPLLRHVRTILLLARQLQVDSLQDIERCQAQFIASNRFILTLVGQIVAHGNVQSHLSRALMAFNYNHFYKIGSDAKLVERSNFS